MNFLKAHKTLTKAKNVLVSAHVHPDPDAISSELAIAAYLRRLGKNVTIVHEAKLPERFLFLPGAKTIRRAKDVKRKAFDTFVLVDCGDIDRIGTVARFIRPGDAVINIDHHVTNSYFGTVNLVDVKASSTAEVIYRFFKKVKFPIEKITAQLLYVGMMTDTGSFRYDNTSAFTHGAVSELMKFPIAVSDLYTKLYESLPLIDLKYFSKVVNTFQTLWNGQVAVLELHKIDVAKFSQDFDLRDKLFRYLRAIKDIEVVVIFTELNRKQTRVNLRSQGKVDVAKIAAYFNGGGHQRASGCLVEGDIKQAKKQVLARIRKAL